MSSTPFPSHPPTSDVGTPKRARRRWWVYALWVFGALVAVVVGVVVAVALYWNSLIKTYTSLQPKELPAIEGFEEKFTELKSRWDAYELLFLHPERAIPEFDLSGEDLNVFAARFGPFRKHAYAEILDNRLRLQFSVPLDQTRNPRLQGRYLNGIAVLEPELKGGRLQLRLASLEANGKPIPGWILRRLQQNNWGERLNQRPEFDLAIRALERLEFKPDHLVLHPKPPVR